MGRLWAGLLLIGLLAGACTLMPKYVETIGLTLADGSTRTCHRFQDWGGPNTWLECEDPR